MGQRSAPPPPGVRPARLDRGGGVPLWQQLLVELTRRLEEGEFRDAFPGELALRDEYGVSRHTVREALRRLREAGTISAARGRLPRVVDVAEIEQPLGALYSLFSSVERAGLEQLSVVRTLRVDRDALVAERLGLEASVPLVHLERLRLAGGEPLALDHVWLPAMLASALLEVDFTHTALYDELARRCGVRLTGGREHLRAVVPSPAERSLLGIDERTAAFAIDRLATADRTPVEWRHSLVRGDRFGVHAEFSGQDGYRLGLPPDLHASAH